MELRKSLIVLAILLVLLFMPAILTRAISLDDNLVRAAELAVVLLGIFLTAHYASQRLERQLREERHREVRQLKLSNLAYAESWLDDLTSSLEDIAVLRELSEKDDVDGKLIVPREEVKPIEEQLLRLELRGYMVLAKFGDFKDTGTELAVSVGLIWVLLGKSREILSEHILPGALPTITQIADTRRLLDKARLAALKDN